MGVCGTGAGPGVPGVPGVPGATGKELVLAGIFKGVTIFWSFSSLSLLDSGWITFRPFLAFFGTLSALLLVWAAAAAAALALERVFRAGLIFLLNKAPSRS